MLNKKEMGQKISELRKGANLSQTELGKKLGYQQADISRIEKGTKDLTFSALVDIAQLFNVSTDYLLGLATDFTTDDELKFVCKYTGLSAETIKTLHKENCRETFLNGTLQEKSFIEKYTDIDVHKIFLKCRNDFIVSDEFTQIVECLALDMLLCESLQEFKKKNDENKLETLTVECYIFLEKVREWKNQHRLNLFNAQDAVNTFLKKYTGTESLDKRFYDNLINKVAKKVNLFEI